VDRAGFKVFLLRQLFVLALPRARALGSLAAFVDGQQIGDEFAGHCQRGAIAMSALQFAGMQRGQLWIPARGQLGASMSVVCSSDCAASRWARVAACAEDFKAAVSPQ